MSDAMGDLMSSGAPGLKFPEKGATAEGVVLSLEKRQDEDMDSGKPKFWDNGDPMWVYIFELQTSAGGGDDDGVRRLFARNKMISTIREAFRAAGLTRTDSPIGGTLKVQYHADGEPPKKGWSGPKLYRAKFTPAPARSDSWEDDSERQPGQDDSEASPVDDDIPFKSAHA